jgi:glycerol uptake facilitator protein
VVHYIAGEFIGAFLGAVLVWLAYYKHFEATDNADLKLAVFCTAPAIRNTTWNLITEIIGTMMLLWGVLGITNANNGLGSGFGPYAIGILVFAIGLSLGGPTGYAINPARDLGPRIAHFLLPIPGKRDSDWGYSWIPVVGPIIGGILGAVLWQFVFLPFWS